MISPGRSSSLGLGEAEPGNERALILIIGGRSKIGAALIGDLLALGQQVRALVRSGEPADGIPGGVETVAGDLADEGSLVTAMSGGREGVPAV